MSESESDGKGEKDAVDKICDYLIARYRFLFPRGTSVIDTAISRTSIFLRILMDSDFEKLNPLLGSLLRGNQGSLAFENIGLSFIGHGKKRELIIENSRLSCGCVPKSTREAWRKKLNKPPLGNHEISTVIIFYFAVLAISYYIPCVFTTLRIL